MPTSFTPVFVDCDNTMGLPRQEIDDGLTLLYLLDRPEVRLIGVSATHGNGPTGAVLTQTQALFETLGVDVPIHAGVDPPANPAAPPVSPTWRSDSDAARALVEAAKAHEGRLVVLGLGATTNLAGAAELDPDFFSRLAGIVLMGGYLAPLRFSRREVSELNFSCDPAASHTVLNAACPVTVMSAQLCLAARFGRRDLILRNRGPRWLRRLVREWFRSFSSWAGSRGFYLWDLLPAVSVVDPGRFPAAFFSIRSTVEDLATGRLVLEPLADGPESAPDSPLDPSSPGTISVPQRMIDPRRFVAECADGWSRTARKARGPVRL
jgi:inosine-uridine nucleoside N-ribohydrolase